MNEITQQLSNISISKPKLKLKSGKYKLAEFFAGTGSFSLGFESTGKFETIYANDIEKASKEIFDLNFKIPLTLGDINLIRNEDIPKMDILTAGFSCAPFSISGKQLGFEDQRSDVFWKLIQIIQHHKPKVFILENVKNLISHDSGKTIKTILDNLINSGYHVKYEVLNTCKVTKVPQNRERVYIVGFLSKESFDKFKFPELETSCDDISKYLEMKVDKKYYYDQRFKCWDVIKEAVTKDISTNTVYQYRRTIVRENKSGVCPTLVFSMGVGGHNVPIIKDDVGIRKLTPLECFKLQGFPDTYKLGKLSDSDLYKLAGNAVSTPVIEKIALEILKVI